jgi:hypothetical protein
MNNWRATKKDPDVASAIFMKLLASAVRPSQSLHILRGTGSSIGLHRGAYPFLSLADIFGDFAVLSA